jgi:hypothetical protein
MALKTIAFAIRQATPEKSEGLHHQRGGNRQRFGDLNPRSCRASARRSVCSRPVRPRHNRRSAGRFSVVRAAHGEHQEPTIVRLDQHKALAAGDPINAMPKRRGRSVTCSYRTMTIPFSIIGFAVRVRDGREPADRLRSSSRSDPIRSRARYENNTGSSNRLGMIRSMGIAGRDRSCVRPLHLALVRSREPRLSSACRR